MMRERLQNDDSRFIRGTSTAAYTYGHAEKKRRKKVGDENGSLLTQPPPVPGFKYMGVNSGKLPSPNSTIWP